MAYPTSYQLFQFGSDPFSFKFEDYEHRPAFTVEKVAKDPNLIVKISRRDEWALQHPGIMGPRNAYLYFGPSNCPGQLAYGNSEPTAMSLYLQKKKGSSNSRYFFAQSGREFKWKILSQRRMECHDARNLIAVWEVVEADAGYTAQITLSNAGLGLVTEVLTTLTLNLMSRQLYW
ncbi:hypothetical protein BD410DRAFT_780588 [Rickenella mellea]|uniref:Uncharacterized protein n=1 Tax=Rickenella mellea TaxID=50990 RepID=A0A4R5XGZ0_9AGAM|nr:hypothetical protein BD410DRAFT_780588 [Rickenella mellea]